MPAFKCYLPLAFFLALSLVFFLRADPVSADDRMKSRLLDILERPFPFTFRVNSSLSLGAQLRLSGWGHTELDCEVPDLKEEDVFTDPPKNPNKLGAFYLRQAEYDALRDPDDPKARDLYGKAAVCFQSLLTMSDGQTSENYLSYAQATPDRDQARLHLQTGLALMQKEGDKIRLLRALASIEASSILMMTVKDYTNLQAWIQYLALAVYDANSINRVMASFQAIVDDDNQILKLDPQDKPARGQIALALFFLSQLNDLQHAPDLLARFSVVESMPNRAVLFLKTSNILNDAPDLLSNEPTSPEHYLMQGCCALIKSQVAQVENSKELIAKVQSMTGLPERDLHEGDDAIHHLLELSQASTSDEANRALEYAILAELYSHQEDDALKNARELYARDPNRAFFPLALLEMNKATLARAWELVQELNATEALPALEAIHINALRRGAETPLDALEPLYAHAYRNHSNDYTTALSYAYFKLSDRHQHDASVIAMLDTSVEAARQSKQNSDAAIALATKAVAQGLNSQVAEAQTTVMEALEADKTCSLAKKCQGILSDQN